VAKKISAKRKSVRQIWTGNKPPMKHSDFRIGCEFLSGSGRWRCTDVGKRTIAAIRLDHDDDPSWYNGPPYAVAESIFDEYDIEGCEPASRRRTYDATGRSEITRIPFRTTNRNPAKKARRKSKPTKAA
jgi:hypothetical protein